MRTLRKSFIAAGLLSLIVLCLAATCQTTQQQSKTGQDGPAVAKEDLSNWQTILLQEKGIKFKLPPDWRHEEGDLVHGNENNMFEAMEWNSSRAEQIRITINTYQKGFISAGKKVSKEEMLAEDFMSSTQIQKSNPAHTEVQRLKISGIEGVFEVLLANFEDKEIGTRKGIIWKGYRIYQGKAQSIDFSISAHPSSEKVLRTIFGTIEIEQDRNANP